jgi:hypothetical protein
MVSSESSSNHSELFVRLALALDKLQNCSEGEERRELLRELRKLIDEAEHPQSGPESKKASA